MSKEPCFQLTFGIKTKQRVAVVQKIINIDINTKTIPFLSDKTKAIATPMTHMIKTLYTLMPTCLLSFNAGIETFLVSQAKKAPKIRSIPL